METKKSLNKYSQRVLSTDDAINLILQDKELNGVFSSEYEVNKFNHYSKALLQNSINIVADNDGNLSVDEFHDATTANWYMDDHYKEIDVHAYLLGKCKTQVEIDRVNMEYNLYKERNLDNVLRFIIFLVDHMRKHNFIWGVGRGSSVASYCLYLIGIHRIDSIKYNLDIKEYLKE